MEITVRALVTMIHGMLFGAFFLLATFGLVVELSRSAFAEQPEILTRRGYAVERFYLLSMVAMGWAAVLMGAYIIYPWYRAVPPAGTIDFAIYPKYLLMSNATTKAWHTLGMEWKEHVAWIAVIVMSMVAHVYTHHRRSMQEHSQVRKAVLVFALAAFGAAGVAGLFGAMLNKYAPLNGGSTIHLMGKAE
jgi:hypothetical protein